MRALVVGALCGSIAVQACTPPSAPAVATAGQNGWQVYQTSHVTQTAPCTQQPILLSGDRTDFTLKGMCENVRITGDHNDITVQVGPAATIEITGGHNDVTWQQVASGSPPQLVDKGISNTFHHEQ